MTACILAVSLSRASSSPLLPPAASCATPLQPRSPVVARRRRGRAPLGFTATTSSSSSTAPSLSRAFFLPLRPSPLSNELDLRSSCDGARSFDERLEEVRFGGSPLAAHPAPIGPCERERLRGAVPERDRRGESAAPKLFLGIPKDSVVALLTRGLDASANCPGPSDADLLGPGSALTLSCRRGLRSAGASTAS